MCANNKLTKPKWYLGASSGPMEGQELADSTSWTLLAGEGLGLPPPIPPSFTVLSCSVLGLSKCWCNPCSFSTDWASRTVWDRLGVQSDSNKLARELYFRNTVWHSSRGKRHISKCMIVENRETQIINSFSNYLRSTYHVPEMLEQNRETKMGVFRRPEGWGSHSHDEHK